jgi:hypothetical protein
VPATIRINDVSDLAMLLDRRRWQQPERKPSAHDGLTDVAGCRRLTDEDTEPFSICFGRLTPER